MSKLQQNILYQYQRRLKNRPVNTILSLAIGTFRLITIYLYQKRWEIVAKNIKEYQSTSTKMQLHKKECLKQIIEQVITIRKKWNIKCRYWLSL